MYKRLASDTIPVGELHPPIHSEDLIIFFDPNRSSFTVRGLVTGTYERGTVALIRRIMGQDMTLVDLGANIGYFSLVAAQTMGGAGRVYSFEPDPDTYNILERNVTANGFDNVIEAISAAIADHEGTATFHQYVNDAGSSSLTLRELPIRDSIMVEVTTLDLWAEARGWPDIDIVKMDIEGAEVAALNGMREVSSKNEGLRLIIEFNAEALGSASSGHEELFASLRELGFKKLFVINDRSLKMFSLERGTKRLLRRARWEPVNLYCEK
jgi:FkbM family methyltransferase